MSMDSKTKPAASIDLESLVNSHSQPFVVVDNDYRIMAVNSAYEQRYGESGETFIGRKCYEVSHGKTQPCDQEGEECPHTRVYSQGLATTCSHLHMDGDKRMHQVKVSAFPLRGSDGQLYLGECIEELLPLKDDVSSGARMVGDTPAFLACVEQLRIASSSDAPVLLQGETGTGKELAAEYIHQHSPRNLKPFQIVDSTVLTENLFETEMFGHARGAYTGSVGEKQGLFELAEGGTIFLDEIGELPLSQQSKLLRVLESGQYRRVGGKRTRKANVRIICATNRHLWESVLQGKFREDLYYRIACLNIRLPNLLDRIDDVPMLARSLLESINRSMRASYHLVDGASERLKAYTYPGNIRELRNILFIAATHSTNREIDAQLIDKIIHNLPHCPENGEQQVFNQQASMPVQAPANDAPASLDDVERQHIRQLMDRYEGNRKKVAEALGVSERTIYRKLRRLGIT